MAIRAPDGANKNIAKGTMDPGVDCFNPNQNLRNHATYPQATEHLPNHTNTPESG